MVNPSAEKVIKAKLDELKNDGEANAEAIQTLEKTLHILGYTEAESTELA